MIVTLLWIGIVALALVVGYLYGNRKFQNMEIVSKICGLAVRSEFIIEALNKIRSEEMDRATEMMDFLKELKETAVQGQEVVSQIGNIQGSLVANINALTHEHHNHAKALTETGRKITLLLDGRSTRTGKARK